jgi:hypothetical protein
VSAAVGVLDTAGMLALFSRLEGRRFLGAVDGFGVVELVFEDGPGGNLISIYTDAGCHTGLVVLGGVVEPEAYVAAYQRRAAA